MAFTQPPFTCIVTITILLSFYTDFLPVSADDPSYTSCPYPCLPAPVVPVTNCPPPPSPPLPQEPVTGYWSYPPPPPSEYNNPYFSTPYSYGMRSAPPPPNPILPWYPWYYYQKQSTSVSKGTCVFPQESIISRFNVVLLGVYAIFVIV